MLTKYAVVRNAIRRMGVRLHFLFNGAPHPVRIDGLSVPPIQTDASQLHVVTASITLLSSIDIGDDIYVPGPSFTGKMFLFGAANITLSSSTGGGIINADSRATAFEITTSNSGCVVDGLTIQNSATCTLYGGNWLTQTGGGNALKNARFEQTKVSFAGVGQTIYNLYFYRSSAMALQMGNGSLSNWSQHSCSSCVLSYLTFEACYTSGSADTDDGIFYAGRSFGSDFTVAHVTFLNCVNAVCFYLDDGMSNVTASYFTFTGCNRDGLIGGGLNNVLTFFVSTGATSAFEWDDRYSIQNATGGSYGAHYTAANPAEWVSSFFNGAGGTIGALTYGAGNGSAEDTGFSFKGLYSEHGQIVANAAILARCDILYAAQGGYATMWASGVGGTFTTGGTLQYTRSGGTPAPIGNAGAASLPSGVMTAIVIG